MPPIALVPADVVLIDGEYLSCDQAALTGESLPVSKKIGDQAYSGSIAKQGSMSGLVTATGSNTFFGHTAKLVGSAGAVSHSQRAVTQVGDFLLLPLFSPRYWLASKAIASRLPTTGVGQNPAGSRNTCSYC
jgi:H+-transporting ATPase